MRGDADFEDTVQSAQEALHESGFDVALSQLKEAQGDLSRRPDPDVTGAVHHALGAVEVTARYIHGSGGDLSNLATQIGLPKPLDEALKKMWGFSSNYGRHISASKIPTLGEAQLIVHLSSAYCQFLANANKN